jgi:metal-responsive CopG/Arc/MetJ family transcriptional regulator
MEKRRYAIEFPSNLEDLLEELAKKRGVKKSEIIRRALASYAFLVEEKENGNKIIIEDKDSKALKELIFMD